MRMSHIAICVSDWGKSLRFYHDRLGFRFVDEFELAGAYAENLHRVKGAAIHCAYLEREGVRIELREFTAPAHSSTSAHSAERFPRNIAFDRPGLSHLSLRVDDLDAVLAELADARVEILEGHRAHARDGELGHNSPARRAVFICDPDGTPIELVATSGD